MLVQDVKNRVIRCETRRRMVLCLPSCLRNDYGAAGKQIGRAIAPYNKRLVQRCSNGPFQPKVGSSVFSWRNLANGFFRADCHPNAKSPLWLFQPFHLCVESLGLEDSALCAYSQSAV